MNWRALGDDLRTFLKDFVAVLPQVEFSTQLLQDAFPDSCRALRSRVMNKEQEVSWLIFIAAAHHCSNSPTR